MDYSEIFCQSVDNIVTQRIKELTFDVTKKCWIKSINGSSYTVTDGGMEYTAYALGDEKYQIDQCVYVLIPGGDYTENKFIISKKHFSGKE